MSALHAGSSDGVVIAVHDLGGNGRDALVAHATGFPLLAYLPLWRAVRSDARLVGPDLRGTGGSTWPVSGRADWQGFADDLASALEATGLADAAPLGIGHSSGATALLLLEARRPGTFAALWCFEPAYFPAGPDGHLSAVAEEILERRVAGARRRRARFATRAAARARLAAPLALRGEALEAYLDSAFVSGPDGLELVLRPEQEAAIYAGAPAAAAALDTAAGRCPVHLVSGELSEPASRSGAEELACRLPTVTREQIAGVAHLGPLTDPAAVAPSLRAWLAAAGEHPRRDTAGA